MAASFGQRFDVVHLLSLYVPSFRKASLAERVGMNITVADSFPSTTVPSLGSLVAVVLLVASLLLPFVLRTEASVCQVGTAGEGAGTLWFPWHLASPPFIRKALQGFKSCKARPLFHLVHHNNIIKGNSHSLSFTLMMAETLESA